MESYIYLKKCYRRIRLYLRIRLGIQQLKIKPYLNVFTVSTIILFGWFWKNKAQLYMYVPELIMPICKGIVHILGISLFIFSFVFILSIIGKLTSRHDESALLYSFDKTDLEKGCPILMRKIYDKETGVTKREFYSNISMQKWQKCKKEIAHNMDIHFVTPEIEYGGKNKNKGKRIVIYTGEGIIPTERDALYDEKY